MDADVKQKTVLLRVAIVVALLVAVAGVLYAKHMRSSDAGEKGIAPCCPCSAHKPAATAE